MAVKTIGLLWKQFYSDVTAWPEGAYHDDTCIKIDGKQNEEADLSNVPDHAAIEIECGTVVFSNGKDIELTAHFSAWEKQQTMTTGAFQVPKEKFAAVQAAIIAAGGTLVE